MGEVTKIGGVLLFAATKFLVSGGVARESGFSALECLLLLIAGGWIGVLVFFNLSEYLLERSSRSHQQKVRKAIEQGKSVPKRRKFKWSNRLIIKIKHRFGMVGLALITPTIISIPIGCIVCAKFFRHKQRKMLTLLLISVVLWALILTPVWYFVY